MNESRYLIFEVANGRYALALGDVIEIMDLPTVFPIPKVPSYYRGMINVHNRPVPVLDLQLKFWNKSSEGAGQILVLGGKGANLALLVDRVADIVSGDFQVEAADEGECGWRKKLVLADDVIKLIDPEKLLEMLEYELNCL